MSSKTERVQPSLPVELIDLMEKELSPKMGNNPSTVSKRIIYAWLSEHGYLDKNKN